MQVHASCTVVWRFCLCCGLMGLCAGTSAARNITASRAVGGTRADRPHIPPLPANRRHQLAPRSLQHPPSIQSGWPLTVARYQRLLAQAMQVQARTCTACPLRRTRRTPGTAATHGRLAGRRAAHRTSTAGREAGVPWDLLRPNRALQEKLKAAGALGGMLWQGSHLPACRP